MSGDLAAFLLARIADDERLGQTAVNATSATGAPVSFYYHGSPPEGDSRALSITGRRLLAECEAKRRIVEWIEPWLAGDGGGHNAFHLPLILAELAAPYAGHPDFDPAWRL